MHAKGGRDYGDSLLKLNGQSLKLDDYFAPFNVDKLDADDQDLGSGGPVLLPAPSGPHPHLVVVAGKEGTLYLIDRDHMGHHQPNNDSQAVQTVPSPGGGIYGSMAYWNHNLYVVTDSSNDALRQFLVHDGKLTLKTGERFSLPRHLRNPDCLGQRRARWSALGAAFQGLGRRRQKRGALYAFDASDASRMLYDSEQNPSRDRA